MKYGLGGYYGDHIELSQDLKKLKYIKLHDYVLNHELKHSNKFDLKHDLKIEKQTLPLIKFVLSHPRTWVGFLPIEYKDDTLYFDWNQLILYGILAAGVLFLIRIL